MPRTMILEPLSDTDLDKNVADMLNEALGRIRSLLNSINAHDNITFVEFQASFIGTTIHKGHKTFS